MDQIHVEYIGGPFDGRRALLPAGSDGRPPRLRAEQLGPIYDSWLDQPAAVSEVHRYDRDGRAGDVWLYQHRGLFDA